MFILLFVSLILCTFINWGLRYKQSNGYNSVKIVDSSSEFDTETELEEIDVDIDAVEDISIIQD